MIMDPTPYIPIPNTCDEIRDTYQKQLNDQIMVRYNMRAVMKDEFSYKFENASPRKSFKC